MMQRRLNNERGFFTIWVLGLCLMVAFVGGLSYDLWHSFSDKRQLSSIVDAAAVAGASEIDLAAFQNDSSVVRLNQVAATATVDAYLERATQETGTELIDATVTFDGNAVVVTASTKTELTLTRLLLANEADLQSTVTGIATPLANGGAQ